MSSSRIAAKKDVLGFEAEVINEVAVACEGVEEGGGEGVLGFERRGRTETVVDTEGALEDLWRAGGDAGGVGRGDGVFFLGGGTSLEQGVNVR